MAVLDNILLTEEDIKKRVRELAKRISLDYRGEEVLMVGILKGSFIFLSDLIRAMDIPVKVDFMAVRSYRGSETTGEVKVLLDLREEIKDRNVLIVEDIVDTGLTLSAVKEIIQKKGPKGLRICALLDKKGRRQVEVKLDYVGFTIPNRYVVGYGLDYEDRYRGLPYIAILEDG